MHSHSASARFDIKTTCTTKTTYEKDIFCLQFRCGKHAVKIKLYAGWHEEDTMVCLLTKMSRSYPQGLHRLWQDGIAGGAQAELSILVASKGEYFACFGDCQCVSVATGHLHNVPASQGFDGLRDEDIIAVPMSQPAKVSPAVRRCFQVHRITGNVC